MNIIYNPVFLSHDTGTHPENAARLESLGVLPVTEVPNGETWLTLMHAPAYIQKVKDLAQTGGKLDSDTVVYPGSYEAACRAVGAAVLASEKGDFALVRPPGHHAFPERSGGFCVFNNVAIAAAKLVSEGKRVFIFDFDGHLGDGTEMFFYDSDKVLYASLHQGQAFPGGGTVDDIGYGKGLGFTVNVPLPVECGDDIYLRGIEYVMSVAEKFAPDAVAVSAGFDGHHSDPLLSLNLSMDTYYDIGTILRKRYPGAFAVLEGGYNLEYFPKCVRNFLAGVNGGKKEFTENRTETMLIELENFEETFSKLQKNLSPYWHI